MSRLSRLLPLILAAALLQACGTRQAAAPAQPRILLALLDLSGSTEGVRDQYLAQVERIVAHVPPGGRLVVLPVSARSLTAPAAVDLTFPEYVWWRTNSLTHSREMGRRRKEALEGVTALLQQRLPGKGTALLDSLLQVQEFLKPYPEGTAALYIISDMVEQSELLDLWNLTEAGVGPALAKVEEGGRLPALKGAAVTVAGLEAAGSLPAARVMAIRSFWEQLLQRADGRLLWYSPTLQLPEQLP
ncbi:MAG: hypothetical protein ACOY93_08130 [Bacillota bacterium]